MPIYEYKCERCAAIHEVQHKVDDPNPTECPACGGRLKRIMSQVGIVFKGSGFHITDYRGGSPGAPAAAGAPSKQPASGDAAAASPPSKQSPSGSAPAAGSSDSAPATGSTSSPPAAGGSSASG